MVRQATSETTSAFRPEVRRSLPAMIGLRLVVNTGSRMMFTFLPEFSRGTGLSIEQLGRLLSLRDLTGLAAPAIGRACDRSGTRKVMVVGGGLAAVGMFLFSLGSVGVVIGLVCYGLARTAYLVSMNAWIGHEVAYERRGRATGQVEMTWAGAALVGMPTAGLLIDRFGWRTAPAALAILAAPLTVQLARRLPKPTSVEVGAGAKPNLTRSGWAAIIGFTLMTGSAQFLVFTHGIWLEETYDFDPSQIGFAIIAVGLAELVASYGSSRLTDRLGKRNSVVAGMIVLTVGLLGLAALDTPPLWIGVALLVLSFLGFEFGIVSAIPLIAEIDPDARAEIIGRSMGLSVVGRAIASLVAASLIVNQGFRFVMTVGCLLAAATTAVTVALVREPEPATP
jgi:predicted MFS family arabinose efflux permease